MRIGLLLTALVLPLAVSTPAPAATCRHLLTDVAGDADHVSASEEVPYPTAVDDPAQVDVRWAELRTTATTLVATLKVQDLAPEGPRTLDHLYMVSFDDGSRTVSLSGMFGQDGTSWARAQESLAGEDRPEDGGVYVGRYLAGVTASRDLRRDLVVFTIARSELGPLAASLTRISASGWVAVKTFNGGTYSVADVGRTPLSYRTGTRDCLSES